MRKITPIQDGAVTVLIAVVSAFCATLFAGLSQFIEYSLLLAAIIGVAAGVFAILCLLVASTLRSSGKTNEVDLPIDDGEH